MSMAESRFSPSTTVYFNPDVSGFAYLAGSVLGPLRTGFFAARLQGTQFDGDRVFAERSAVVLLERRKSKSCHRPRVIAIGF